MSNARIVIPVAAAMLIGLGPVSAHAQGAPLPPPPRVTQRPATTAPAAAAAPAPVILPAPIVPPPPPKKVVPPASALPPKDSAVALCNNGTWVMIPGTAADCASRGGLRVAMVHHTTMPPAPGQQSAPVTVRPGLANQGPPAGTTMRCKDGTYLSGAPSTSRCANNGGVAAIFPAARPAPKAPAAAVQKRP